MKNLNLSIKKYHKTKLLKDRIFLFFNVYTINILFAIIFSLEIVFTKDKLEIIIKIM